MDIEKVVALSVKHNASDLHLCSHMPAYWRQQGKLLPLPESVPEPDSLLAQWLTEAQRIAFDRDGHLDFAITLAGKYRLRANAFRQQKGCSLALRLLPSHCPTLKELYTPVELSRLLLQRDGLILAVGATGSGKSTTLTAMVAFLNQQLQGHIITLEDPVEFIHQSQRCLIQQREIGAHCQSFSAGLRAALREDPDVILLGELRDNETIRLALTAAQTGHLVLATLHTCGSTQAVERLVDVFPAEEKVPVRHLLAGSLRAVVAQKLCPAVSGERVALYELLINTPAVANIIREGKMHQLPGLLQMGQQYGMQTFSQSEATRIKEGLIAPNILQADALD